MDVERWMAHLAADGEALLAAARKAGLEAPVPSCPDWTVRDLVEHTAMVYEHKIIAVETGKRPDRWPPEVPDRDLLGWYADAHRRIQQALASREADETVWTWYAPEQNVRFWVRRMAQETVVHRVDAELAAAITPVVSSDIAADGVDEALHCFVADELANDARVAGAGESIALVASNTADRWSVRFDPTAVVVTSEEATDATVTGTAQALLLWLWGRGPLDVLTTSGDPALPPRLRELAALATL